MTISVIINPGSGPAHRREAPEALVAWAEAWLRRRAVDGTVRLIAGPGDGTRLGREALDRGADLVIAWGGDGTVNAVASALVGGSAALGIVPAGSGNGLASELGIPRRRDEAFAAALDGRDRTIDAGELNGHFFFNVAGIGFDAHVAHVFAHAAGHSRGFLSYVVTTVRELFRYEPSRFVLSADEGRVVRDGKALLVSIANTRQWGNGAQIAPQAEPDDGRLDFVLLDARSPFYLLTQLWRLYTKSIGRVTGTIMRPIRDISMTADPPAPVHLDGEPMGHIGDIHVRVIPGAIRVRVPRK